MPKCTLSINLQVGGGVPLSTTAVFELDSVEVITKCAPKASDDKTATTTALKISGERDSIDLLAITTDGAPVVGKPVTLREVQKKGRNLKPYDDWDEGGRLYRGSDAKAMFDLLAESKLVLENKRPSEVTLQVTIGRKFA